PLGRHAGQAAAADVEGALEGHHQVVGIERQPQDVVAPGLDDLPQGGVGTVGEGQEDRGGGAVLVEGGQAAEPGAAGQRRAGEQHGEGALLGDDVADGADPAAGDDLDPGVDASGCLKDLLRQVGGAF